MKILLAEDNPNFQALFRDFLLARFPGCTVTVAANGRAAARELRVSHYDLLLTDLHMPGGNGDALIMRVRSGEISDTVKAMPIILITSVPEDEALPVDGVLGSVIDLEKLHELIVQARKKMID